MLHVISWERPIQLRYAHRRLGFARWINAPYEAERTIFLLSGKCGNSSVKAAVMKAKGLKVIGVHQNTQPWSLRQVARSNFLKIGVVRNPYARAVSIWTGKVRRRPDSGMMRKGNFQTDMSFLAFLRALERVDDYADLHFRAQWKGMYWRGAFLPDRIVRLEDPNSWKEVRKVVPKLPPLRHLNASSDLDWRPLCEGEAGEIIRRRWARDFEVFDYPV